MGSLTLTKDGSLLKEEYFYFFKLKDYNARQLYIGSYWSEDRKRATFMIIIYSKRSPRHTKHLTHVNSVRKELLAHMRFKTRTTSGLAFGLFCQQMRLKKQKHSLWVS